MLMTITMSLLHAVALHVQVSRRSLVVHRKNCKSILISSSLDNYIFMLDSINKEDF